MDESEGRRKFVKIAAKTGAWSRRRKEKRRVKRELMYRPITITVFVLLALVSPLLAQSSETDGLTTDEAQRIEELAEKYANDRTTKAISAERRFVTQQRRRWGQMTKVGRNLCSSISRHCEDARGAVEIAAIQDPRLLEMEQEMLAKVRVTERLASDLATPERIVEVVAGTFGSLLGVALPINLGGGQSPPTVIVGGSPPTTPAPAGGGGMLDSVPPEIKTTVVLALLTALGLGVRRATNKGKERNNAQQQVLQDILHRLGGQGEIIPPQYGHGIDPRHGYVQERSPQRRATDNIADRIQTRDRIQTPANGGEAGQSGAHDRPTSL